MPNSDLLKIFVAMPGTDMGPNAKYQKPESVKENLLQPVADELKSKLDQEVILTIEKDKKISGVIHESMFAEAQNADVYIADLTGANPNVYLELGVRWALRDRVTILICQNVEDLKFNVIANRALLYNPDRIVKAKNDIVDAIINRIKDNKPDNPVRLNSEYLVYPKGKIEELHAEIERLKKERGEELLRIAITTEKLNDRINLLKQAISANPAFTEAFLELGKAYRELNKYTDAINTFQKALKLNPDDSTLHRELGVTFSKQNRPDLAVLSLREAVRLSPKDSEAWSNLGGALRRLGVENAPHNYNRDALLESYDCYNKAHELNKFDLYSGLNVPRLELMLSKWEPSLADKAKEGFSKQIYLCRHMVQQEPDDYWRKFDLADALLFSDDYKEAASEYGNAISAIPIDKRKDTINSVLGPLQNYITANVIDGDLLDELKKVIAKLEGSFNNNS